MSTPHLEPKQLDVPQVLAHDWINRHGIFRTVSTGGQRERTGTDWGMVITEAARWGQRSGWDARGAAEARQQADQKPPLGLMPRWLADEKRLADVDAALQRYKDANLELPGEWLWERQDLLNNLQHHHRLGPSVKESLTAPPAHTIAECGGPCEQDFRLCDCGLLQKMNPQRAAVATPETLPPGLVEPEITRRELARIWNDNQDPNEESGDAMARLYSAGFHAGMKWQAHLAEQGAAPAAEAQPAGGLVERVAEAMQPGTFDWSAYEDEARAAIREVAAFLEAIQGQWCDSAAEVVAELVAELRQEADRA